MAGAIIVSENGSMSLNSLDFGYIIEKIRSSFRAGEELIRDEIYSPIDDGGMSFISLKEQSTDAFNAFFRAASLSYERELSEQERSARKSSWDELMMVLRSDPRAET